MSVAADTADGNRAVLFNFNQRTGLLLNALDHLAGRPDDLADVFRINLDGNNLRSVRT